MISVVIPTSGRPDKIGRAIKSVLMQSGVDLEILVIENNSEDPDKVKKAVEEVGSDKVRFYSLKECRNANVARNFGFLKSTGDYISYLDSDDEYLENHLYSSVRLMEEHSADFVYGSMTVFNGEKFSTARARPILEGQSGAGYLFSNPRGIAPTPTYLVRRSVLESVRWDENLARHQDLDFFISITSGYKAVCKEESTVLVHWIKGEKRFYCFESMVVFYIKWRGLLGVRERANYSYDKVKVAVINKDLYGVVFFGLRFFYNFFLASFKKLFRI